MPKKFTYDVFLSHNAQYKLRVRRLIPFSQLSVADAENDSVRSAVPLRSALNSQPACAWMDEWVIQAGDIISLKVDEGLEQSRVLLLCISPAALASGRVALERSTAVHRDPANAGRRFIPLLLGDCALADKLRGYKYFAWVRHFQAHSTTSLV